MELIFLGRRLARAIATFPAIRIDWLVVCLLYAGFAWWWGLRSGFLRWERCHNISIILRVLATSLLAPALLEEVLFRALLLPHPLETVSRNTYLLWSGISLLLFVVYHPVNGWTFWPQGRAVFTNPVFLFLAAGLGLVCTIAYGSTGSLWLPVLLHWLVVVVWLLLLGGLKQLHYIDNDQSSGDESM